VTEAGSAEEDDAALIRSAFAIAARDGWGAVSVAAAAREAGLPLGAMRARFPGRHAILLRLGLRADQAALRDAGASGTPRERLFDLLMARLDALQEHRAGVLALLRALPGDPGTALLLASATGRSLGWMLDAAGIASHGLAGAARAQALLGAWLWTVRAWERDDSADLSATMAALDRALDTAGRLTGWPEAPAGPAPFPDVPGAAPALT
jgi:ubiquinone biosynthesis protein COQ9